MYFKGPSGFMDVLDIHFIPENKQKADRFLPRTISQTGTREVGQRCQVDLEQLRSSALGESDRDTVGSPRHLLAISTISVLTYLLAFFS